MMYVNVQKFIEWQKRREETNHDMSWATIMDCLLDDYAQADAVEVVRCKNCKWKADTIGDSWCDFHEFTILSDDDFCSYGERKDDEVTAWDYPDGYFEMEKDDEL